MTNFLHLIEQYGLSVVFINVLLEQLGLPLPAYPALVVAGALLNHGGSYSPSTLLLTAVSSALIADLAWYLAGRRFGRKVISTLCRLSLTPDSCVRQTESIYERWGARSLLVAKFIPGFASIASALAGTTGTRLTSFVFFDSLGAALWAGLAIFLGSLFSTAIDDLLSILEQMGKWGIVLIGIALAAFIAAKLWQRYRFLKSLRMARITVEELNQLLKDGALPTIFDVRSTVAQKTSRIPGALPVPDSAIATSILDASFDQDVIVYCSCPNEVSAARIAKQLMQKGYLRVRPLTGGIDAWIAAGYPIELHVMNDEEI